MQVAVTVGVQDNALEFYPVNHMQSLIRFLRQR
jgi:hypothetical protein